MKTLALAFLVAAVPVAAQNEARQFAPAEAEAIWNDAFPRQERSAQEAPMVLTRREVAQRFGELPRNAEASQLIGVWAHSLTIDGEKDDSTGLLRRPGARMTGQTFWFGLTLGGGFAPELKATRFHAERVGAHIHMDGNGHEFSASMAAGALMMSHACRYKIKWECRLAGAAELLCRSEEGRHAEFPNLPPQVTYHGFRKLL